MENVESQNTPDSPSTAGARLRQVREAAGLSRADIATQTKIAERHLLAIEENRFGDLAARTYAVGFSRAYARALGLDEGDVAEQVRKQLDAEDYQRTGRLEASFEPGDPARVPPSRIGWVAAAGVVVVVGLLIAFWGSFLSPAGNLPDLVKTETAAPPGPAPAPAATATPAAPAAGGPVVMTATADKVWVKVTDAAGAQLLQKELALGESWAVPQDAQGPQLRTGRPDALKFTVGGKPVPALTDKPVTMSGVSLAAADLLARASDSGTTPAPGAAPAPPPAVPSAAAGSPTPQTTSRSPTAVPQASSQPAATTTRQERYSPASYKPGPALGASAPTRAEAASAPAPDPKATLQPVSTVSE